MGNDVAVVEDVWGAPFEELAQRYAVGRHPQAWRDPDQVVDVAAGARALVVRNRTRVDRALLSTLPDLAVVARAGSGLDNIDVAAADEHGIVVTAPLGVNAASVAEHALGLALALARRTLPLDRSVRDGQWSRQPGRELAGRTWGLLGLGATGRAVARVAAALGMDVLAYDPYVDPASCAGTGIRLGSLEEVAIGSDVLSVHVPATAATVGLVDAAFLLRMRADAVLINLARGEIVDEEALADALEKGEIAGAGLDVRASEPPTPGRLERLDSVILTPHVGGITVESQHRIAAALVEDILAVLDGGAARRAVGRVDRWA